MTRTTLPARPEFDRRWPRRAVLASAALHLTAALVGRCAVEARPDGAGSTSLVDIELAPAAPTVTALPPEVETTPTPSAVAPTDPDPGAPPEPPPDPSGFGTDAAPPDAAPPDAAPPDARPRRRPDAALVASADAGPDLVASTDAGPDLVAGAYRDAGADDGRDAGAVAAIGAGADADPTGGDAATVATGVGDGSAAASAGTPGSGAEPTGGAAANLLPYAPAGALVAVMVRFDRLRGTRWQAPAERLFRPMPDHQTLIGDRPLHLADLFETLVITTPAPRDATATTLVGRTRLGRPALRDLLDEPDAPVTWSTASGGLLGRRRPGARVGQGDRRVFLSPRADWFTLAQPRDLPGLTTAAAGDLDTAVARTAVPAWLGRMFTIEAEAGPDPGPALVLTLASSDPRLAIPDVGLGVASVPAPQRWSAALTVDKHGFVVRGHLRFASAAEATEFADGVTAMRQRVLDSTLLRGLAARSHALGAVERLSLTPDGARVAYGTSLSTADALALLEVAAVTLDGYFAQARP